MNKERKFVTAVLADSSNRFIYSTKAKNSGSDFNHEGQNGAGAVVLDEAPQQEQLRRLATLWTLQLMILVLLVCLQDAVHKLSVSSRRKVASFLHEELERKKKRSTGALGFNSFGILGVCCGLLMAGVASRTVLLPGRADATGTNLYAQLFATLAGTGHFRKLPTHLAGVGDLTVSSIGLGTYLGPETDAADTEYEASVSRALSLGINVFDAAINYRSMRSERNVGSALNEAVSRGVVSRQQVVVCTKGGYLTFDADRPANARRYLEETFIKPGIFGWADVVSGCHCMTPAYIRDQLEKSRSNLRLETIDVYYVHNPETQLSAISREEFNQRIKEAFSALEDAVKEGKISVYGVATWNGFRVPPEEPSHLSLEDLVTAARAAVPRRILPGHVVNLKTIKNHAKGPGPSIQIWGQGNHFRVVQAPFNLQLQEVAEKNTQVVGGRRMPLIDAAKELDISIVASGSLMQAKLARNLPSQIKSYFKGLGDDPTDAQCSLQFVRTSPGILTALAGMRQVSHVEENAAIIQRSALSR